MRIPAKAVLTLALPVGLTVAWTGLNHDVRYVLGVMRVGGEGGLSATEIFVHRPLFYRLTLDGRASTGCRSRPR